MCNICQGAKQQGCNLFQPAGEGRVSMEWVETPVGKGPRAGDACTDILQAGYHVWCGPHPHIAGRQCAGLHRMPPQPMTGTCYVLSSMRSCTAVIGRLRQPYCGCSHQCDRDENMCRLSGVVHESEGALTMATIMPPHSRMMILVSLLAPFFHGSQWANRHST